MNEIIISISIVAVIVVVAAWCIVVRLTEAAEVALGGVWVASNDEFCRAADIDAMMLVIGEPVSDSWAGNPLASVVRPAQLVILDGIHSGSFDLKYRRGYSFSAEKYEITAELMTDLYDGTSYKSPSHDNTDTLWCGPVTITLDIPRGLMVVVDASDEIVAVLSRDNAATETCQDV